MLQFIIPAALAAGKMVASRGAASNAEQELDEGAQIAGETYQDWINRIAPMLLDQAKMGGDWVTDAGEYAAGETEAAAGRGVARMDDANELLRTLYEQYMSELAPYKQAGVDSLEKAQGVADEKFVFSQDDPSYQWRMEQGQKALERSRAARGGFNSGATLKALTGFAQGMASTEYGAAFDRFQKDRSARYGMLSDLVGVGERANTLSLSANGTYGSGVSANNKFASDIDLTGATTAGGFRTNATKYASDLNFDATKGFVGLQEGAGRYRADARKEQAEARASGHVARGNAWNTMFSDFSKISNDYFNKVADGKGVGGGPSDFGFGRVENGKVVWA